MTMLSDNQRLAMEFIRAKRVIAEIEEERKQRGEYQKAIDAAAELMDRIYRETPEYKAKQEAKRVKEAEREAAEAAEVAEYWRKREERSAKRAKYANDSEHIARARRSRIDWSELIDDPDTVQRQIRWERCSTARAMSDAGLTYREIGERMGLSKGRVGQLVQRAWRRKPGAVSPAEAYMNAELHKEVQDLVSHKVALKPFQYLKIDYLLLANGG